MPHDYIEVADVGSVMVITMDDPTTRNAIGSEMSTEINAELDRLEADPNLRAVVLTGRDPSFCSGANVKRMDQSVQERSKVAEEPIPADMTAWEYLEHQWAGQDEPTEEEGAENVRFLPLRLHNLQKPSIAAVNGYAMGLGLGIALSCDIRLLSENARLSETFIRRGLIPADGSCWQLPRMIGLGNTFLMQYTGDVIDSAEALRLGLASKVVSHDELMETTMDLAQRIADGPTYSMALIKKLVQDSLYINLEQSLRLAGPAQEISRRTEDHKEGVRAFVEKRRPAYTGR